MMEFKRFWIDVMLRWKKKKSANEALGDDCQNIDEIELQNMVFREVCGAEHPRRVRLGGMGLTPSMFFGQNRHNTSDVRHLEAELVAERCEREALLIAERAERDALLAVERAELDKLLAAERTERDSLIATEQAAQAKLEARLNELTEMLLLDRRR